MTKRIAIIGGGIAGNAILHHVVNHPKFDDSFRIDIFDSKERMGRGKPYIEDSEVLLLNIPSDEMSMTNAPYNFVEWLESKNIPVHNYNSRKHFGDYSEEMFRRTAGVHSSVQLIDCKVTDVVYNEEIESYAVTSEIKSEEYDAVFLTVGQLSYSDPYRLKEKQNYIHNPYPLNYNITEIDGSVGVIGTGLSAIDCVRYLIMEQSVDGVRLFSRSGDMPSVRGTSYDLNIQYFTEEAVDAYIKDDLISLDKIIKLFKKEMSAQGVDEKLFYRHPESTLDDLKYDINHADAVGKLQYLIIAVNPLFSRVFPYFTKSDKSRFMREIHPLIDKNHSPMPPEVAAQLVEWAEDGRVVVIDGIDKVVTNTQFEVMTDSNEMFTVDYLINATGPIKDVEKETSPLIVNLVDRMLIASSELGGLIVDKEHRIISPRYGTLKHMYAIGNLTFSSDYMSNTVNILVKTTKLMVEGIMED
ncbi:FAD/NAD(P)-binding protein [Salinicoccus sp. YB14-2]|uniref:FAD/NAD(P)-binding protein n=1 Tax=Salinicoccus sp. YB14-2 TaxID=1572701 RepID=UPI0006908015|nr:FAD/NAD(P)-binding protein [Salinicoccus sp. YB14-2]